MRKSRPSLKRQSSKVLARQGKKTFSLGSDLKNKSARIGKEQNPRALSHHFNHQEYDDSKPNHHTLKKQSILPVPVIQEQASIDYADDLLSFTKDMLNAIESETDFIPGLANQNN